MIRAFVLLASLIFGSAAFAQQLPPYTYPLSLGTSSVQILAANTNRKKLIFHNPNATALVAVCPVGPTRVAGGSSSPIVAAINGAGCVTLLPYDRWEISGETPSGPQQQMSSAWVGIGSTAASLTVLEFE